MRFSNCLSKFFPPSSRRRSRAWRFLPALLVALLLAIAPVWLATPLRGQSGQPSFSIGIVPFQDVSGNADLGQLASVLPTMLQSVLLDKTQLVPRQLQSPPGEAPGQALDLSTAASLGQQSGADVVAIGTLLAGSVKTSQGSFSGFGFHGVHVGGNSNKISVTVLLQVDLVDVNRGVKIATLRARGRQTKTHFDPNVDSSNYGSINMQSAGFQNSALGQATNQALVRLSAEMARALQSWHPAAPPAPPGAGPVAASGVAPAPAAPASSPAPGAAPAAGNASGGQPNLAAVKVDFVPGEKTLFYDDFTDMAPDEPPPHWQVRGDTARLLLGSSARALKLGRTQLTSPVLHLPASFTFEVTESFGSDNGKGEPVANWHFLDADGNNSLMLRQQAYIYHNDEYDAQLIDGGSNILARPVIKHFDFSHPAHLAIWVQNGRVRLYINGQRLADVNQVAMKPVTQLRVVANNSANNPDYLELWRVRLAASAPDFASAIAASGKFVTHGIHFATNSAILQPSSAPVVRQVADGLLGDPNLKLQIIGYTDSTGSAKHNLRLSKQRAAAVSTVLSTQFGIDASRLTAVGKGAAHPIGSNDTAAGRAENRRVEFVKQP